ncbi:hypothetical protein CMV_010723 [Castanea mollissima]|uniref:Uncharacterized protein n=1 Tax=Castanea mollissima TaxID=60419 RepID=A0A8J4RC81_9ROSI|nr:hypothetical protein CMV_010723 [Castanea mollissima]
MTVLGTTNVSGVTSADLSIAKGTVDRIALWEGLSASLISPFCLNCFFRSYFCTPNTPRLAMPCISADLSRAKEDGRS